MGARRWTLAGPAPIRLDRALSGSAAVLAVCAVVLVAGYALKAQCSYIEWDGAQFGRLCYNDIQPLYGVRGIASGVFPYLHGDLEGTQLRNGAIEYPVLTGLFMWVTGRLASDWRSYLGVSALLLAPFALVTAYLLARMVGARALLWGAAPALGLYAFHNWDLLVVAFSVAGMWLWYRQKPVWAGVCFGVGAAFKLYPILFLIPLVLERWSAGDRRGALYAGAAGGGVAALINLPFAMLNFSGWWATYKFHELRTADFNTFWHWGFGSLASDPSLLNAVTGGLTAAFLLIAVVLGLRRSNQEGQFPFVQVCGALLAAFMLWGKVHSPQYALWILPFFALLRVGLAWWIAYSVADLLVYVGIFRWFYDFAASQDLESMTLAKGVLIVGVWGRAALLLALFFVFLSARSSLLTRQPVEEATVLSRPASKVVEKARFGRSIASRRGRLPRPG